MVTIASRLRQIKGELQQFVPDQFIFELCKQCNHVWRKRGLDPAMTVHLLLLQLLAKVSLQGLRHVSKAAVSAQAVCQARMRLPLAVFQGLVEYVCQVMSQQLARPLCSLFKSHRVVVVDGTSFLSEDTEELAGRYKRAKNQRGTSNSYPVGKLMALMDLGSGLLHKVIDVPVGRGERSVLDQMFRYLQPNDLVLGDRGLISFAHVALLLGQKLHCLMRLPRGLVSTAKGRTHGRQAKRLGKQDWLVCWMADRRPQWMTREQWKQLPREIQVRQIAYRVCRRGYRPQWAWLITTLTDPQLYPAQELIELYEKRWQVEVDFRDMKKTMGFSKLSAQAEQGVGKEILAFVLLYNLTRQVMLKAAAKQQVDADRISFIDALRWLLWSEPGEELPKLVVNPKRQRNTEPRRIKRGRHRYPQLNAPRKQLRRPRHEVRI